MGLTNWANSESIRLDSATVATGAALGGNLSVAENAAAGFDSANSSSEAVMYAAWQSVIGSKPVSLCLAGAAFWRDFFA